MKNLKLICFVFMMFSNAHGNKLSAQNDARIILTPKPGSGTKNQWGQVFGVRPGSPFLFTIPVTGERPFGL